VKQDAKVAIATYYDISVRTLEKWEAQSEKNELEPKLKSGRKK
jgi:DNA-binding transcriptional regulator YiaG